MNPLHKIIRSVRFGALGLRHAFRSDQSFRLEIVLGAPAYAVVWWLLAPLSTTEAILYVGSYALILIVELVNTSIEVMLERVHPDKHEAIGRSKDISAGAVLVSFLFAIVVVVSLAFFR